MLLFLAFISYFFTWKEDQSILSELSNRQENAQNLLGKIGASLGDLFVYNGVGLAAFVFAYLLFVTGLHLFVASGKPLLNKWVWGVLVALWIAILFGFFTQSSLVLSGVVGYELNAYLSDYLGTIGTVLLLALCFVLYAVLKLKFTAEKGIAIISKVRNLFSKRVGDTDVFGTEDDLQTSHSEKDQISDKLDNEPITPTSTEATEPLKKTTFDFKEEPLQPTITNFSDLKVPAKDSITDDEELHIEVTAPAEEKELSDIRAEQLVEDFGEFDPTLELSNYKFPTLDLLNEYGNTGITINQEELEENKNTIVQTLKHYKIDISQIKATIGPTVTLYEIVPAAGIRISKIKNLEDDIALSLAALGIRIIAPIPGKGTIGIEVPNKNPSIVSMRSVIASQRFQKAEMELPIAFGKTISNETFVVDLAKMPHMLMAGATGQGKSVGLNAVLTSLLYKKHPAEVKFVLVDPKKVELTLFNKIERHYLAKLPDSEEAIITDNTKVINTLNSLCIEMDNRYEMLKNAMVRNIKEYNAKFKARKLNPNDGHKFLPYIVLVVDEFADLIMTAGKEVETPIARLAQLARAIGIHLIIATQRPSVNVITGIIKANFPARIAFRVTSKIDSRTILDTQGADQLIGRGDMLFTQGNEVIRLQCAFVDTPEVSKITDFIGSQRAYPDAHLLPEYVGEENGTSLDIDISERDALFREAAEVIVTAQQGSASLLQRKLKLGYNRAGRLIDQLEAAGIVGPFEGSKARQVLIPDLVSLEQFLTSEQDNFE